MNTEAGAQNVACHEAKQRVLTLHSILCVVALCLNPRHPRSAGALTGTFETCMQAACVAFACEAFWVLNFAHTTSEDKRTIMPSVFLRWWLQYAVTATAFALVTCLPMYRMSPWMYSSTLAFVAAAAYCCAARLVYGSLPNP